MKNKIKVNIGSGTSVAEGWINIDNSWNIYLSKIPILKKILLKLKLISIEVFNSEWKGKKIRRCNVIKGLPFKTGSVDVIYCSHLIEHLTQSEAKKVCREVWRVLKNGGVFRIVTPDLKLIAQNYISDNYSFFGNSKEPIDDLFLKKMNIEGLIEGSFFEKRCYSFHKHMYDKESLKFLLKIAGFDRFNYCDFRVGSCPDLEIVEKRLSSIYLEAFK